MNRYVEQHIGDYERHLERHELDGAVLLAQAAEQYGLERIHSGYKYKTTHILRVLRIPQLF